MLRTFSAIAAVPDSDHPPAPADVLAALRAATADRHAWLDQAMPLSRPQPGLEDYRAHLLLLQRWLAPLETWLGGFDDGPQDPQLLPQLSYAVRIEADLGHPAMPSGPPAAAASAWWKEQDAAYRWGLCYVVEGSQLGGAVMYKALAAALAPHPLLYLRGDAAGPGPRWQRFIRALRESVRAPDAIAAASRGAADAFDALIGLVEASR